jgi:ADP-ribosyl-[dinitrogen reductase] hydrolase
MDRALGALIGSAVGDALGAPFEFGPPGAYSRRFPAHDRIMRSLDSACG